MTTAWIVLITIACYFALLFIISWTTGRKADNDGFFTGNRKTPWFMAMFAMIGASISGVTFISVPGAVLAGGYSYMQMVLGFFVGAVIVALVLIPMFYRMNLVSIYGYLEKRFGMASYRTGAWFFFVSKMLGASVRFFVVCVVLQTLVFTPLGIPFWLNVVLTVALIWLYSFQGGVKSLIWTDSLKTLCLIGSVVACIIFIAQSTGAGITDITEHPTSRIFYFDDSNSRYYFWKQFIAGIFMLIATTGLDQDLMQRTMSCKNFRDSQKNMIISSFIQIFVIGLFLLLGTLLYIYKESPAGIGITETGDSLFGAVTWSDRFPMFIGIIFIIGLVSAAYSAAGSALTALTTSFTVDILRANERQSEEQLTKTRKGVHIAMSILMIVVIVIFYILNNDSAINAVYSLAAYTYGPILGMFIFGMGCKQPVNDRWVPIVAIVSPIICYILQSNSEAWFGGYQISFELLIINALITAIGLCLLIKKSKKGVMISILVSLFIPFGEGMQAFASSKKNPNTFAPKVKRALVTAINTPSTPTNGLQNRHIALWQSHGWYFEQKLDRWEWQRARLFQTVEDLYTQSYVLPFLVPMLENAGANVLIPRERDCNKQEVIIDNDGILTGNSRYSEIDGKETWNQGNDVGFAHLRSVYKDFENPFNEGTYRQITSIKKGEESIAEWLPEIPETNEYAVYVSYKTVENSTDDALYTVYHKGGTSQFRVNQQMGGGTWIYLGTFSFDKGQHTTGKVTLSNLSDKKGRIVTADGVKIGGGMGNIARSDSSPIATPRISEYPRFAEASRYWMQWAGIPDSIYSASQGEDDYSDDYKCRSLWVNYLAGGSSVIPNQKGLNIPIDLSLGFHTDAGTTLSDSIIGTLGIYYTQMNDGLYANGAPRSLAMNLTDTIMTNIVNDIRLLYEPHWTRREMWDKSYFEARPEVPAMLLELLSHQNFADMRYGLDPRFRFTVSRAIYKGILKFIATQRDMEYVVQPLPVDHFSLRMLNENEIELTWQPVNDPLEPTAQAEKYIVYTRIDGGAFDNGRLVEENRFRTVMPRGVVCSYKVVAVNKGGKSFPSEILSAGHAFNSNGTVMVINGFDRISSPADFVAPAPADTMFAGFLDEKEYGVPYIKDFSYTGSQKEFRRAIPWMDDDAAGFGDSYGNYETEVIAGNTFDYPAVHGKAILKAGYSFVSCSDESLTPTSLNEYKYIDLILGKERQTKMGRGGVTPLAFKTFTPQMQEAITTYCQQGGNIFISGSYVASDLWDNTLIPSEETDRKFATEVLRYKWRVQQATKQGKVKSVSSPFTMLTGNYTYHDTLNSDCYVVEAPDAIEPASEEAYTVMRYSENNMSAGVAFSGTYKTLVLGFPFEALKTEREREEMMKQILEFFNDKKK